MTENQWMGLIKPPKISKGTKNKPTYLRPS